MEDVTSATCKARSMVGPRAHSCALSAGARQHGAYAVEFAFVFILFFVILYGLITYGLLFTAQQSVNLAAQDAARHALRWQPEQAGQSAVQRRALAAVASARQSAGWLAGTEDAAFRVAVCTRYSAGDPPVLVAGSGACSSAVAAGQMNVLVAYHWHAAPLVPALGFLFGRAMTPEFVIGTASVHLDEGG